MHSENQQMTLIEAAVVVLRDHGSPMRPRDIWTEIDARQLHSSDGRTPWATLTTQIIWYCKGVSASRDYETKIFYRDGPGQYGLLEWLDDEILDTLDDEERMHATIDKSGSLVPDAALLDTNLFLEEEWHRWLFSNLEQNGLATLGFGPLVLFDAERQSKGNLGKYNTKVVGEIDMLLQDERGNLIVVELKRKGVDQTVGQICRYVGWVETHLASANVSVHGVIIAQTVDEKLRYAIKPIKDHIFYQQLAMSVEFGESSRKPEVD